MANKTQTSTAKITQGRGCWIVLAHSFQSQELFKVKEYLIRDITTHRNLTHGHHECQGHKNYTQTHCKSTFRFKRITELFVLQWVSFVQQSVPIEPFLQYTRFYG